VSLNDLAERSLREIRHSYPYAVVALAGILNGHDPATGSGKKSDRLPEILIGVLELIQGYFLQGYMPIKLKIASKVHCRIPSLTDTDLLEYFGSDFRHYFHPHTLFTPP